MSEFRLENEVEVMAVGTVARGSYQMESGDCTLEI